MNTNLQHSIASLLIVSITGLGLPLPAQAGMVGTESTVAANRDRIATLLDRSDVRAQLEGRGVSPDDAKARVAALTDEEVDQLAGRIDSLPAGSGGEGVLILGLLFFAVYWAAILVTGVVVIVSAGIKAVGKGIEAVSKQTSSDDSRTGSGQETEVKH